MATPYDPIVIVVEDDTLNVIETGSDELLVVVEEDITVLLDQSEITILESTDQEAIVIVSEGMQGPPGPAGPPGPGGQQEVFVQSTAPVVTPVRDHIWIQTGLGPGGTGFLAQFMDGA